MHHFCILTVRLGPTCMVCTVALRNWDFMVPVTKTWVQSAHIQKWYTFGHTNKGIYVHPLGSKLAENVWIFCLRRQTSGGGSCMSLKRATQPVQPRARPFSQQANYSLPRLVSWLAAGTIQIQQSVGQPAALLCWLVP
jgi:hypothetical protein